MKLRLQSDSVRLRLSTAETARIARGEGIVEQVPLPGGVLGYRLTMGGEEMTVRCSTADGIEIMVPAAQAMEWAASPAVSMQWAIDVDGGTLKVLIEKDLKADDR